MYFLLQNHWEFQSFWKEFRKRLFLKTCIYGKSAEARSQRSGGLLGREDARKISEARCEFAAESVHFLNGLPGDGLVTKPGGELGAVGGEGDMTPSLKNNPFQK